MLDVERQRFQRVRDTTASWPALSRSQLIRSAGKEVMVRLLVRRLQEAGG